AANDTAEFLSLGSGNWICTYYKRASGQSISPNVEVFTSSGTFTAKVTGVHVIILQAAGGGGGSGAAGGAASTGGGGGGGGAGESRIIWQSLTAGSGYTVT